MSGSKILGVVLLALGILALAYRGFSYTKDETKAKVGPVEIQVQDKKRIDIPLWAGAAAAAVGGLLLLKRS